MKSKLLLLACLCFLTKLSLGQDKVITITGDTLIGSYDIQRDHRNMEFLKFEDVNGKKDTYKIYRVKRIEDKNGDVYEPIQVENLITFGKKIKEGYLSLFYYTEEGSTVRYNHSILVKADGSSLKVPGIIGFRNGVGKFLSECADLQAKLDDKVYGKTDLDEIIDEYNRCLDIRTNQVLAEQTTKIEQTEIKKELSDQFDAFRKALDASSIANKKEALDMFNDLADKLVNDESVPSYLSNALKQAVSADSKLTNILNNLLK